jgi:hypothetical protein
MFYKFEYAINSTNLAIEDVLDRFNQKLLRLNDAINWDAIVRGCDWVDDKVIPVLGLLCGGYVLGLSVHAVVIALRMAR